MNLGRVREDPVAFAELVGVELWDWQKDVLRAALRRRNGVFVRPVVALSWPRGDSKTYLSGLVGAWRLVVGPVPGEVLSAALDTEGAKLTVRYGRQFLRPFVESGEVLERADGFEVPATGSRWTITSRDHTASRGRHPTTVLYDETGWAKDSELFESLLSSQSSVSDPLLLVTSTVGARAAGPLWDLMQRADAGDPAVFFEHSTVNRSKLVTPEFLARMRRLKHPLLFAREHQNSWQDADDSFVLVEHVDAAMGRGWDGSVLPEAGVRYAGFVDIGLVSDPTVIAVGHDVDGVAHIDKLITHQGSRQRPVSLPGLRSELRSLAELWRLSPLVIESWQGLTIAADLVRDGVRAEVRTPTAQSQSEMWSALAAELGAGNVTLAKHDRLREELLNLRVELRPTGALRVFDRGRVHQDHAVAVGGVVQLLVAARRVQTASTWCYRCSVGHPTSGEGATPCVRLDAEAYHRTKGGLIVSGPPDQPSEDVFSIMLAGRGLSEDRT